MNKVNKAWWRKKTKSYKFSPKNIRNIPSNEDLLKNATKWRIVVVDFLSSKRYIIEGYVDGEWKILKGTAVIFSTSDHHWYRDCENAYNRCKKLARKFPEIKMNALVFESAYASMRYGSTGYKRVNLKDISII